MTASAHALVAAAIANKFPDPILAPSLAFVSHFVMDSIPHLDFGTHWRKRSKAATGLMAIGETLAGIFIAFIFFGDKVQNLLLLVTIIFSIIPDWLEAPWYIFFASHNKLKPAKKAEFWEKLTYRIYQVENTLHAKAKYPWGVITQVATVIFFLILLK